MAESFVDHEPSSYSEETQDDDHEKCEAAMMEEMEVLKDHEAWKLVHPSTVLQKFIDCIWVLKENPKTRETKER